MLNQIKKILNKGHQRSVRAKRNILGSLLIKFVDASVDFAIIPISLAYLTQTEYGIWLTVSAMVNWLNLFDFGISHGFRNKLSLALSSKNFSLAKEYTSTAYFSISMISVIIGLFGLGISPWLNWSQILNAEIGLNESLVFIVQIIISTFTLSLIFRIINSILLADQSAFLNNLLHTISKLLTLLLIAFLPKFGSNDLLSYAAIFSFTPPVVLFISSLALFSRKFKAYAPSISHIRKSKIKDIIGLGLKFFVIQIGVAVLFLSDNLIIAHVLSPADVATYQITQKYFSVILILFTTIATPFWSAITEAYAKGEIEWIKRSITGLNKVWLITTITAIMLGFLFDSVVSIWLQKPLNVPVWLIIQTTLFVILQTHNIIFTTFLNGIGKITVQMFTGIITILINIPLSIFFSKNLEMGSSGVLLATNISIFIYIITRRIQYRKIVNNNAHGIWSK